MHRRYFECWRVFFLLLFLTFLSTSSLAYKALCISFLVLWFICLSSSLVHFKNGPEYLRRGTAKVLISLMRILQYCLVSSSFLVFLSNSYFFLSSRHVWCCPLPIFPNVCKFPLFRAFWFFYDSLVLFLLSFIVFRFSLKAWHIFYFKIHLSDVSIYPHSLY